MKLNNLSEDNRSAAVSGCLGFVQGECFAFAIAVHEGTGLPLVGIECGGKIVHAGVRIADGRFFDGRGYVPEDKVAGWQFREIGPGYTIVPVTKERLYEIREGKIFPNTIVTASQLAQVGYPELPWNEACFVNRVKAFAHELEKLSRKHGFYITPFNEKAPPVIWPCEDDVWEYSVSPGLSGGQYFLRREIES